jgi:hypothetical protein
MFSILSENLKTMRLYKLIDAWVSAGLIIFFISYFLWNYSLEGLFVAYFVTGGWQVISMIVHAYHNWFTRKYHVRHIYHWITLISLITFPLGSFWVLLFTAPFMAVFYTWICFYECRRLLVRPISVLR